ncbi:glyoxalase superfamily protein [Actinomadura kijaniata]|uniref:glyoxalase superfamily protein n=1 Tax=Actinomadura kijaniata TaxID=46161 RepID=UPI003F19B33A
MTVAFTPPVPILRVYDLDAARAFYLDYLGCTLDWEHRTGEQGPWYLQVSRGALVLHLSQHHGDGTPGTTVYVETRGVEDLHAELAAKNHPFLNPGLERDEIGTRLTLADPFGNHLRFNQP